MSEIDQLHQTDELVAFLQTRLDEDERAAQAATPGPWRYEASKHWHQPGTCQFDEAVFAGPAGAAADCVATAGESNDRQSMADAAHIARHDPVRVWAEVDAKRRIIERCKVAAATKVDDGGLLRFLAITTLRDLAQPSRDHPDYHSEWAPND